MVSSWFRGTFASLAIRNYRLFFIGQAISQTGSWMQKLAQAWLVLELTDSGVWLGLTLSAQQLPTLLFTAWAGVLADRFKKRTILMYVSAAGPLPAVALAILSSTGHITIAVVMAVALVTGLIDAAEKPARQSFPSEMVGAAQLANALSLNNVVQNVGKAVGPAIAGVLISFIGVPWTFVLNAMSFVAVFFGLALMNPAELDTPQRSSKVKGQLVEGLKYVARTPALLGPLVLVAATGLFAYNFNVFLPLLARSTFEGDARLAGYMLAAFGIGSVVGGIAFAGILVPTLRRIVLGAFALACSLAMVALSPTALAALLLLFVVGAVSVVFRTLASTWVQLTAHPSMRGRVVSLLVLSFAGTTPIGAPIAGWASTHLGVRAAFWIAALSTAATAGAVTYGMRRRDDGDSARL